MLEINQKSLTVPLIQGGMGVGVSLGNLAGHVAQVGAMGVISTAHPGYKEDDFESNHRQANIRALKKEILKAFARIDDKYKNEKYNIQIDTSPRSIESMENEAKLTVVMSKVSDTDVVVCNKTVYEKFAQENIFFDWEEIFDKDYQRYEPYMTDGIVDLSKFPKWREGNFTTYSPTYFCILKNSEHIEEVEIFLKYLMQNSM